ncbi:5,6-dimethylbenzimidazole synthase [Methylocystaceae bacterium]|nr:5,6-dimethylbenzimidazole synthase [Methylocystaceae bacterium]
MNDIQMKKNSDPAQEDISRELAPTLKFDDSEREAVYRAIYTRRDVRNEFLENNVPHDVLMRILDAAHHAPSVGLMQPWNFIVIRDPKIREGAYSVFQQAAKKEEALLPIEQRAHYRSLKLEGILKAPLNICVTCDRNRGGEIGLGRTQQPDTDLLSTACAVQNLWLAARVEGIGVGWVSILSTDDIREILKIPDHIVIVAYLCVGYVDKAYLRPELEVRRWSSRLSLDELVFEDGWGKKPKVL